MATDDGFNSDPLSGGSYAHLLESSDVGSFSEQSFIHPSSLSHRQQSRILCFGNKSQNESEVGFLEGAVVAQKSGLSGSDSSSTSSSSGSSLSKSKKEGIEEGEKEKGAATADSCGKACKKQKTGANAPTKVKKEKLGERITALQKLVSPYGKTDTASVLHEAMGYIKFLHDQVQVLSSPYLQRLPSSARPQEGERESRSDLRSRGLCLVPIDCTVHVANSNGADFWSPVMGSNPSSL